jgi:hypothetical protein
VGTAQDLPVDFEVSPLGYLQALDSLTYLESKEGLETRRESAYLIPLGAMQKLRGAWHPESSERFAGEVAGFTWRMLQGFESEAVLTGLEASLGADDRAELLFSCDARACGNSSIWANTIFEERLLYGRAESQRYRAYSFKDGDNEYRLLMYASARSSDRQYFHAEVVSIDP